MGGGSPLAASYSESLILVSSCLWRIGLFQEGQSGSVLVAGGVVELVDSSWTADVARMLKLRLFELALHCIDNCNSDRNWHWNWNWNWGCA